MLRRKAEARADAELWAEVEDAKYGEIEIAAVVTEPDESDYLADLMNDLDSMIDSIQEIAVATDE